MNGERVGRGADALSGVRELIFSGEYRQGSMFSENKLAERLGVSRTPVREALTILERQGLVERIPQVGVRVREFTDDDLRETFDARGFLEPTTVAKLTKRIRSDDIELLEDLLTGMERGLRKDDIGGFLAKDVEFHWRIAEQAGLFLYRDWLRQIGDRIRIVGFIATPTREGMQKALDEHVQIFDALRNKDPESAVAASERHLLETKKRIEAGERRRIFTS